MEKLQGKAPQIRFPEFKDAWEKKKLNEIIEINPTNTILPERFIYIDLESVTDGKLLKENEVYKNNAPSRAQRVLKRKDVLFQMVRPYQKNNLYFDREGDYVASTGYAQIRTQQIAMFIYQYLHFQKFVDKVILRCTGTSYPAINSTDLSNIEISFPTHPEQTRIASFFTVLDKKIAELKQKKNLLEQYKKGVMQKLFSQELRFKDKNGEPFPKWEKKKLGQIGGCFIGLTYSPNDVVESEGTLVLRSSNIQNGTLAFEDNVFVNAKIADKNFVKENDILICARNGSRSLIGKCALIKKEHEGYAFGAFMSIFRSDNNHFVYQLLQTDSFYKQVNEHLGATINQVTTKSLNSFSFLFPCKEEQNRITDFLSGIDRKIEHTQELMNKTQQYKKGLLQKMFCE